MKEQDVDSFQDLYLDPQLKSLYYQVLAYKYVFQNISLYIDKDLITPYPQAETKVIKLFRVDNLSKWAKKK